MSARSHQETERGLGLACVFVPLFLDPLLAEDHQKMGVHITKLTDAYEALNNSYNTLVKDLEELIR